MRPILPAVLGLMLLAACATPGIRQNNANRLAMPVFMIPRTLTMDGYQIKLYERAHVRNTSADVYIEDSGEVWGDGFNPMKDPTPNNPVGLVMASNDSAKNVFYIGRTCQYGMKKVGAKECPQSTLRENMYAPDMIALYNGVLDEIKRRYGITGFHLAGFGTGGGLATILAASRGDTLSLRTAAGVLDTDVFAKAHGLPPMTNSQNPVSVVPQLIRIPQHHYIAQLDEVVPNDVYHSFAQAFGDDRCLSYTLVQNVDHTYDWSELWTGFAKEPVTCMDAPSNTLGGYAKEYTPAPADPVQ